MATKAGRAEIVAHLLQRGANRELRQVSERAVRLVHSICPTETRVVWHQRTVLGRVRWKKSHLFFVSEFIACLLQFSRRFFTGRWLRNEYQPTTVKMDCACFSCISVFPMSDLCSSVCLFWAVKVCTWSAHQITYVWCLWSVQHPRSARAFTEQIPGNRSRRHDKMVRRVVCIFLTVTAALLGNGELIFSVILLPRMLVILLGKMCITWMSMMSLGWVTSLSLKILQ